MTAQNKTTIKSYFETGDRPTQGQFENLIDSYQDVSVLWTNIQTGASAGSTGVVNVISQSSATFLPAGTVGTQLLATVTTAAAQNIIGIITSAANVPTAAYATTAQAQAGLTAIGLMNPVTTRAEIQAFPTILNGYISGFTMGNNAGDATNDLDIAAGFCIDSTNVAYITGTALTKRLDAVWTVGNNGGLLDTGAVGNNTYHVYSIKRDSDGVGDYISSLSTSGPLMPTGYTYFRRVNVIVRVGGVNKSIIQSAQGMAIYTQYATTTLDVDTSTLSSASTTYTLASIPVGMKYEAIINAYITASGTAALVNVRSLDQADAAVTITGAPLHNMTSPSGGTGSAQLRIVTNSAAQIAARSQTASTTFRVAPTGFMDGRAT